MAPGASRVRFGEFEFDPRVGELHTCGRCVRLRPQSGRVLGMLASRPGEMVGRDEIQRAVWGDATHVDFEQGIANVVWEIRKALGDSSTAPRYLEVLPRRGLRLLAPVSASEAPAIDGSRERTVAVLPFENLSTDPAHEPFVDAMTDELICLLAQSAGLHVISRTSVLAYKGWHRSLPALARELNVEFILEGAVAWGRRRVRVNAQLVDARSDATVWSQSYERTFHGELALERGIARHIVGNIRASLL